MMDDKNFDKSQMKTLCRGNRTDRGWKQDKDGRWTPSVFDRRRIGVTHSALVAEANGLPGVPVPLAAQVLSTFYSTGDEADIAALLENFKAWLAG